MKLLTKNSDYAIRALIVLAKNKDRYISAKEISESEKIPYQFLRRLLQDLIKNDYITSKEGVTGGVKLKKDYEQISVTDVMKVFQGELDLANCLFRKKICANSSSCVLRKEVKRIEEIVLNELKQLTVGELIRKTGGEL
jgi:Rrf2 family protein